MRIDVVVIVRILGLIALLWTNWPIAIILILLLAFTPVLKEESTLTVKEVVRLIVEIGTYVWALIGIWDFPLIDNRVAHMLVYVAVIISVLSSIINIRKDLRLREERAIHFVDFLKLKYSK